jgi:hypothetical protein
MKKPRVDTMTHDYKRHGTTTRFAALDALEGTVSLADVCSAVTRTSFASYATEATQMPVKKART